MTRSHSRRLVPLVLLPLASVVATCTVNSPASAPTSPVPSGTTSTAATATAPPASGVAVEMGGYTWTARLDKPGITAQPTVTWGTGQGSPGQVLNSPPGSTYLIATITLTNSSDRAEPGLDDVGDSRPNPAFPVGFAIAQRDAQTVGLTVMTFTASDWPILDGTPPPDPQCALNGDPSATYGGYCDLRSGDAAIAQATPEVGAPASLPQIAPGGTQQVTIFVGPVSQNVPVTSLRLLATAQGPDHLGFTLIP